MSRSSPQLQNPASHLLEWNGGHGTLSFYDKEQAKNIEVKLPFEFLPLDQLNGVTGWSDRDNTGIWSTETRSTKDTFSVFAGRKNIYTGPYKDANGINQVAGFGGKYCKIVYFAAKNKDGEYIINRLKLTGAALNAWIELTQRYHVENGKVVLSGSTEGKKGATTYQIPTFEYMEASKEEDEQAILLDKALQNYLAQYLTAPAYDDTDTSDLVSDDDTKATPEQIAEFESLKAKKLSNTPDPEQDAYNRAAVDEVFFTDDDIPPEFR